MAPDINPIYVGFERSCLRDSKNVSYVDVELVKTCFGCFREDLELVWFAMVWIGIYGLI